MLLEREIGRVHADELAELRRRHSRSGVRAGLAASLHRLAERIEPRLRHPHASYDA